jgi:hypothetical protein
MDPAYSKVSPLFQIFPFAAAGVVAGLIAGFGFVEPVRLLIRFAGVLVLFLLLFACDQELAIRGFAPPAVISFLVSACLSSAYFRLLVVKEVDLEKWAQRWGKWKIVPDSEH